LEGEDGKAARIGSGPFTVQVEVEPHEGLGTLAGPPGDYPAANPIPLWEASAKPRQRPRRLRRLLPLRQQSGGRGAPAGHRPGTGCRADPRSQRANARRCRGHEIRNRQVLPSTPYRVAAPAIAFHSSARAKVARAVRWLNRTVPGTVRGRP